MDLVIYDANNKENVISAYNNCYSIPQKDNTIIVKEKLYTVITEPCFSYEKNTVWVFVKECK